MPDEKPRLGVVIVKIVLLRGVVVVLRGVVVQNLHVLVRLLVHSYSHILRSIVVVVDTQTIFVMLFVGVVHVADIVRRDTTHHVQRTAIPRLQERTTLRPRLLVRRAVLVLRLALRNRRQLLL